MKDRAQYKYEVVLTKQHGFRKFWLDDKDGWWLSKPIKHPILSKLKIVIDGDILFVECEDSNGDYVELYLNKFSWRNLAKIERAFA